MEMLQAGPTPAGCSPADSGAAVALFRQRLLASAATAATPTGVFDAALDYFRFLAVTTSAGDAPVAPPQRQQQQPCADSSSSSAGQPLPLQQKLELGLQLCRALSEPVQEAAAVAAVAAASPSDSGDASLVDGETERMADELAALFAGGASSPPTRGGRPPVRSCRSALPASWQHRGSSSWASDTGPASPESAGWPAVSSSAPGGTTSAHAAAGRASDALAGPVKEAVWQPGVGAARPPPFRRPPARRSFSMDSAAMSRKRSFCDTLSSSPGGMAAAAQQQQDVADELRLCAPQSKRQQLPPWLADRLLLMMQREAAKRASASSSSGGGSSDSATSLAAMWD